MAPTAEPILIKRGRKFEQVLDGARIVFMRDGYDRASVDDIAAEASVSKATLYSYFPDKGVLFIEVAKRELRKQADEAEALIPTCHDPAEVLTIAARRIIDFFVSDFGRAVFRICVAESARFPELGREFHASGPALVRERLANYLNGAVARGRLRIDDVHLAADQFAELCHADLFPSVVFGVRSTFTDAEITRVADGAVATFLARYGTAA